MLFDSQLNHWYVTSLGGYGSHKVPIWHFNLEAELDEYVLKFDDRCMISGIEDRFVAMHATHLKANTLPTMDKEAYVNSARLMMVKTERYAGFQRVKIYS